MTPRRIAVLAVVVLLVGCNQPPAAVSNPLPDDTTKVSSSPTSIEANDAGTRTACARRVLDELIRAFNAGDALGLDRTVGAGPLGTQGFQWVSFFDAVGRDAEYTVEGARRMLLGRWSRGQRLSLLSVSAGDGPSWHGGVDAGVKLESRAPGVTGTVSIVGKTALSCVGSRVFVLSVGEE